MAIRFSDPHEWEYEYEKAAAVR